MNDRYSVRAHAAGDWRTSQPTHWIEFVDLRGPDDVLRCVLAVRADELFNL